MITFIPEKTVLEVLDERLSFRLARETFKLIAKSRVSMPPKLYLNLRKGKDFRAMPAAITGGSQEACGIKWISVFPDNRQHGKPTVNGTVLLSSAKTGETLAVVEANALTALRTAATATLAAKYLAKPKPRKLAIVGAGLQASYQLRSIIRYFNFKSISIVGFLKDEAQNFCRKHKNLSVNLRPAASVESCVSGADIIITCTPSRRPLIRNKWIKPGAHINAIGADAKGKQELEAALLKRSKVIVDQWEQASHSGEINVPVSKKLFSKKDLYAELSDIVSGKKRGRSSPDEITIFDSTGLAALDIYFAQTVFSRVKK